MSSRIVTFIGCCLIFGSSSGLAQKSQCDAISAKVAVENQNTIVNTTTKRLVGTWFSQGCEIRPGPQYVLRSYTFKPDGSYKAIQHHYRDNSCSQPKFTVLAMGVIRLKRDSMLNPEAATGYAKHANITVTPQDNKAAKELEDLVAQECPERSWKSWRRHEEHVVFEETPFNNNNDDEYLLPSRSHQFRQNVFGAQQRPLEVSGALNCLGPLKWAFNELKLLKIQLRPEMQNMDFDEDANNENTAMTYTMELLLGDIHSRAEQRDHYRPTAFQVPLVKYIKDSAEVMKLGSRNYTVRNTCTICGQLQASSDRSPPHLLEKPHLPPYIWGEWVSTRCEVRPMGLYLTRKFSFYSEGYVWVGEHKFYEDPFCTVPKFLLTAAGHYLLTSSSTVIAGSTNIDFKIEKATLKVFSKRMAQEMSLFKGCGRDDWQVDRLQDLANGCLHLGVLIPSLQYEIVKVEMNYEGSCLLYLGQPDTDNMARINNERPSAFQDPLIKCGDINFFDNGIQSNSYLDEDNYNYNSAPDIKKLYFVDLVKYLLLFTLIY